MLPSFVLGVALVAGVLLAGRWYATADTKVISKAFKWMLLGIISSVVLFFIVSGKLAWAFAALPALLPWFFRLRAFARAAKTFARMRQAYGPRTARDGTAGSSDIETQYLRMWLDHDTGTLSGEVISGPYSGRFLGDMSISEVVNFLYQCDGKDPETVRLLESYLDRTAPHWREASEGHGGNSYSSRSTIMDRAQAFQILGLAEGATAAHIKDAHRRLISGMHPDHGGSDYLAAQINQAKDILLGN